MLDYYGWIMPLGEIDHPEAERNGNRIFIHKDDVREGDALKAGCLVEFYLFVDEKGLGAEDCRLAAGSVRVRCQQGITVMEGRAAGAELLGLLSTGTAPSTAAPLPSSIVAARPTPGSSTSLGVGTYRGDMSFLNTGLRADAEIFVPSNSRAETTPSWSSGWSAMPPLGSTMRDMRETRKPANANPAAYAVAVAQAHAALRRKSAQPLPEKLSPQADPWQVTTAASTTSTSFTMGRCSPEEDLWAAKPANTSKTSKQPILGGSAQSKAPSSNQPTTTPCAAAKQDGQSDSFAMMDSAIETNLQFLFDDEDNDEISRGFSGHRSGGNPPTHARQPATRPLGSWFADEQDAAEPSKERLEADEDDDLQWRVALGFLANDEAFDPAAAFSAAPPRLKKDPHARSGSPDGSTSAGESSDSDASRRESAQSALMFGFRPDVSCGFQQLSADAAEACRYQNSSRRSPRVRRLK